MRPTVFGDVAPDMTIAREEIFGPVLVDPALRDEDEAVRIANDTPYGLAAYVSSADLDHARRSRPGYAPARSTSTIRPGMSAPRSAGSSNRATDANTPSSASTTIWSGRRSSATAERGASGRCGRD